MISGARQAEPGWFHRMVARAMSRRLTAFVVPGPDVARAHGLDVEATGLQTVDTPRHASVLLLIGDLPEGLHEAAAVAYAQMMRPRAIFAVGTGEVLPLPEPDVSVDLDQELLAGGVEELRRAFAEDAFANRVEDFEAEVVQEDEEEQMDHGDMHHEHGEEEQEEDEADQEADSEGGESEEKEIGEDQLENFMSMIEMTEGMPASGDGLIMEWVPAPYGPLFPGLPGGLSLTFTLDGDRSRDRSRAGYSRTLACGATLRSGREPRRTRRETRPAHAGRLPGAGPKDYRRRGGNSGQRRRSPFESGRPGA